MRQRSWIPCLISHMNWACRRSFPALCRLVIVNDLFFCYLKEKMSKSLDRKQHYIAHEKLQDRRAETVPNSNAIHECGAKISKTNVVFACTMHFPWSLHFSLRHVLWAVVVLKIILKIIVRSWVNSQFQESSTFISSVHKDAYGPIFDSIISLIIGQRSVMLALLLHNITPSIPRSAGCLSVAHRSL